MEDFDYKQVRNRFHDQLTVSGVQVSCRHQPDLLDASCDAMNDAGAVSSLAHTFSLASI